MRRTCRDKHEESSLKNLQKACKSSVVKINKYIYRRVETMKGTELLVAMYFGNHATKEKY